MSIAYFVRGGGESWAVVRLTGRDREDIVADKLSKEAAIERCAQLIEELPRRAAATEELPLVGDIAPGRRRPRQLALKF